MMYRRTFLGLGATLSLLGFSATASAGSGQRRLLILMLRGGMDGLTAVPPVGDSELVSLRGSLIPRGILPATDFFGVHPILSTFAEMMAQKQAVAVHATGWAYKGRSHFEGQDVMQSGLMKPYTSASGWLGRAMERANLGSGVAISIPMPLLLRGDSKAETQFPSWMQTPPPAAYELVKKMWEQSPELAPYGERLAGNQKEIMPVNTMANNFEARKSSSGLAREAALRMQAFDGPMVGLIDFNGFDTHASQGAEEGVHATRLKQVDDVLKTFKQTMGSRWRDSLVLTLTEFGRTVAQNGTTGTDHGWGGCILAAGGLIKTAGVITDWPSLAKNKLFEGRDLAVTIDAAAVYAQAIESVFGLTGQQINDGVLSFQPHPLTKNLFA